MSDLFEALLREWGRDPGWIRRNWTMEIMDVMVRAMARRKQREADAWSGKGKRLGYEEFMAATGMKAVRIENAERGTRNAE